MGYGNYTVKYEKDGTKYKLCRIFFGADGSYYVTSPYHPAEKAALMKVTVNYALSHTVVPFSQAVDIASAEDDEKRIKFSHHPDGFAQFSGHGVVSGKDSEGNIRGVGVMSWPLDRPVIGPAFGISIVGVEQFERADRIGGDQCVFNHEELTPLPGADTLALEGYYFPPLMRRFVQTDKDGSKTISVVHPAGFVLRLKVLLPTEQCERQGFIGVELYKVYSGKPDKEITCQFIFSGPTGNLRENEHGQTLRDGIYCMYPRSSIPIRRNLDFVMDAVLSQPRYSDDQ
jgi:hypothetical protein